MELLEQVSEYQLLLQMLDASVHDTDRVDNFIESPKLHEIIRLHAVHGLVAEYMVARCEDMTAQKLYFEYLAKGVKRFHQLMAEQQRLSVLLREKGIGHVILKGSAAAVYYPKPEARSVGDIDLIVEPGKFEEAHEALLQAGYRREEEPADERHIAFFAKSGTEIELHWKFSYIGIKALDEALDQMIFQGIEHAEEQSLAGYVSPVLPVAENGIVLLAHISQHLRRGIGLRQIMDWMLYVEHELSDEVWRSSFAELAEQIGMKTLAETVTLMCRKYLGLQSEITWCDGAEETVADELMEYVLRSGNFGKDVDGQEDQVINNFRALANPRAFFLRLQNNGVHNWKAARENRFLRCFAWLYQLGRVIKGGILQIGKMKEVKEKYDQSRRENEMLNKLGVNR